MTSTSPRRSPASLRLFHKPNTGSTRALVRRPLQHPQLGPNSRTFCTKNDNPPHLSVLTPSVPVPPQNRCPYPCRLLSFISSHPVLGFTFHRHPPTVLVTPTTPVDDTIYQQPCPAFTIPITPVPMLLDPMTAPAPPVCRQKLQQTPDHRLTISCHGNPSNLQRPYRGLATSPVPSWFRSRRTAAGRLRLPPDCGGFRCISFIGPVPARQPSSCLTSAHYPSVLHHRSAGTFPLNVAKKGVPIANLLRARRRNMRSGRIPFRCAAKAGAP